MQLRQLPKEQIEGFFESQFWKLSLSPILAPGWRDDAHDTVDWYPACLPVPSWTGQQTGQGTDVAVLENPLRPQGDLNGLFAVGSGTSTTFEGYVNDAEPHLGLSPPRAAASNTGTFREPFVPERLSKYSWALWHWVGSRGVWVAAQSPPHLEVVELSSLIKSLPKSEAYVPASGCARRIFAID